MYSSYRVRNHQTGSGPVVLRFTIQLRAGCNFKSLFMVFLFPLWITSFHLQARWTVFQPFICGLFFMFPVNVQYMEHERMETGDKHLVATLR